MLGHKYQEAGHCGGPGVAHQGGVTRPTGARTLGEIRHLLLTLAGTREQDGPARSTA